jgi:hypothetical protein
MITFAHGLYFDELLWFVVPVGLSLWALRWAERRAREKAEAADAGEGTDQAQEEAADRPGDDR